MNPTNPTDVLAWLLTGVFLLLYGVRQVSDSLQRLIRGRMQPTLIQLSKYPLAPFGIGLVTTALIQSSSAVATLLVELVSLDLLPLSMAIVMLLGANVGSTLMVQLLVFHITNHALELLGLGSAVALFTHRAPVFRRTGRVLFAFALIVLGLAAIGIAGQVIAENNATKSVLHLLEDSNARLVLILIGTFLAIVLNSSVATIGLVITLAQTGALQPTPALVLMLGANVGTTLLSMLASLNQGTLAGRRLAVIHTGTKLLGAVILLLLIDPLALLLQQIVPNDAGAQVALAHVGFNVALAILFVPFAGPLAMLMERLLPDHNKQDPEEMSATRSLDPRALALPEVAQGLATREMLRMGDIVTHMFEISINAFGDRLYTIDKQMNTWEDQLDALDAAIKGYLTQLDEQNMTEEQARLDITLLTVVDDLEAIGDVITRRFMNLARRQLRGQLRFSDDGWADLKRYHQQIAEALQQVLAALAARNPKLATRFLNRKTELKRTRQSLRLRHIRELRADIPHSKESSAVYLDLLDALNDVLAHTFNIAYILQEHSAQPLAGQFRSLRTGSFVKMSLINTQQLPEIEIMDGSDTRLLPETMNVAHTRLLSETGNETDPERLYVAINGINAQPLYETLNGANAQSLSMAMNKPNTQQLYMPPQLDGEQVSEW